MGAGEEQPPLPDPPPDPPDPPPDSPPQPPDLHPDPPDPPPDRPDPLPDPSGWVGRWWVGRRVDGGLAGGAWVHGRKQNSTEGVCPFLLRLVSNSAPAQGYPWGDQDQGS